MTFWVALQLTVEFLDCSRLESAVKPVQTNRVPGARALTQWLGSLKRCPSTSPVNAGAPMNSTRQGYYGLGPLDRWRIGCAFFQVDILIARGDG
jgi:hypothetical protein